jgi:hypothetical protein
MRLDRRLPQRLLVLVCLLSGVVQPGHAEPWKDCAFNDTPIRCLDSHASDGTVRIVWEDGKTMTYHLVRAGFPLSTLRDSLGGIWERQIFPQGNALFKNPANGNRIFVPLRPETIRP